MRCLAVDSNRSLDQMFLYVFLFSNLMESYLGIRNSSWKSWQVAQQNSVNMIGRQACDVQNAQPMGNEHFVWHSTDAIMS